MTAAEPSPRYTAFDVTGLVFVGVGFVFAISAVFWVQPLFSSMYLDLGGELPRFTTWCLKPAFPLASSFIAAVPVLDGLLRRVSTAGRAVRMVLSMVIVLGTLAAFVVGIYLPIFAINAAMQ